MKLIAPLVRDAVRRAALSVSRLPSLVRSVPARAHAARHLEQWITIDWSEADVSPFSPDGDGDGEIGFLFGNHRSKGPVLIEGKTVLVDCPPTIGARVHKLSHTTSNIAEVLELYPRTSGLIERECGFEVPPTVRVRRNA